MRCTLATVFGIAALAVTASASAEVFAVPHLVASHQDAPLPILTLGMLGAGSGIHDLRAVQEDPTMRARRDFSLMAALPVTLTSAPGLPSVGELITPSNMKLSRDVVLTFPLGIRNKSFVTAQIGKNRLAIDSTGFHAGGVFTFKGEF